MVEESFKSNVYSLPELTYASISQTHEQADVHKQIDIKWPETYMPQTYIKSPVAPSMWFKFGRNK